MKMNRLPTAPWPAAPCRGGSAVVAGAARLAGLALLALLMAPGCSCSDSPSAPDAGLPAPDAEPFDAGVPDAGGGDAGIPDAGGEDGGASDAGASDAGDGGTLRLSIRGVLPSRGALQGGTVVEIEGEGFYRGFAEGATAAKKDTRLYFGQNEASDFTIVHDRLIEALAPPNPAGPVDVRVQNPNGLATCPGCFTYFVPLELHAVAPAEGPLEGGVELVVEGKSFAPELSVTVAGRPSPKVVVESDTRARALLPRGPGPGAADVRAFNRNGVGELKRALTYYTSLALAAVEPAHGPTSGGTEVVLRGRGLAAAQRVGFGAATATFTLRDDQTLEVTVPAAASPGPVDVLVRTSREEQVLRAGFVYVDPSASGPALAGIVPAHGPAQGGNRALLVGAGLEGAEVEIGGAAASVVGSVGAHALEIQVPPGPANARVDVVARVGSEERRLASGYRYDIALSGLEPTSGPAAGGQGVALTGAGFTGPLEVLFGGVLATGVSVQSANALQAETPPGLGGCVDVTVRDAADPENQDTRAEGYCYLEALWIGRVHPDVGAIAGGTFVTVYGAGFAPGVVVEVGSGPLKDLRLVDANTLTGRTPPGAVGEVDVAVSLGQERSVLPSGFTYFNPENGGGGSSGGPIAGTLNVTVLNASAASYGEPVPGATVMLGSDPATPFQGRTDKRGQITFSDPQLVKAQQVTAFKEGFLPVTVARQESQNLTLFLPAFQSSSGAPGVSPSTPPSLISGRVTGFKLPRPLNPGESAWAEVWVAPSSIYSTDPLGYSVPPAQRDANGERWRVTEDGGVYTVFSGSGLKAVYAVFGIGERATGKFTPLLFGVRRGVNGNPDKPAVNQDIALTVHLDAEIPVTVENPLVDPVIMGPATNAVYAWLLLGAEGVVPIAQAKGPSANLRLTGLPRLDGENFVFANHVVAGFGSESIAFRRQLGDLSQGVSVGPMLGLVSVTAPRNGEGFDGQIQWQCGDGPDPDLMQIDVAHWGAASYRSVWRVILPGADRAVTMPGPVWNDLRARMQPGDMVLIDIVAARIARFDYAYWSNSQLSMDAWSAWTSTSAYVTP